MKRLVLLLLNLLMPMILFAASNDLCFRHFSVEDGLSSNSVRALMQDIYGFLWIGTDEGLNRYDGTTVKLYRLKDRGANEAISSLYSTLNKIWIGTDEGIYIYDYETEDIMLITDTGTIIRMNVKEISVLGRATQGVTLMRTNDGGKVVSIEIIANEEINNVN